VSRYDQRRLRKALAFFAAMICAYPVNAAERLYCFSDICLGDLPSALNTVTLSNLLPITEKSPSAVDLTAALPGISEADRATLAKYVNADGRFLVDQRTLPIFLKVNRVCAPIASFVAIFTSDSGHSTAVEFDVVAVDGHAYFGVKTITRAFRTKPDTPEYLALIADLSEKFGVRIGAGSVSQMPEGITAAYEESAEGFRLSFSMPNLKNRGREIASQQDCIPENRVKID
jgi:hypothetical protein